MDAWCIIAVCGVSAFTVDTQAILQRGSGFVRDCLHEGSVPKLASLPMLWVKGSFHVILFKSHRFFMTFMPDKCILKLKIRPMTSSLFHGIYRILRPDTTPLRCYKDDDDI